MDARAPSSRPASVTSATPCSAHAQAEENGAFRLLQQSEDADARMTLGQRYEKAKRAAPTHPHPHAPDSPPGNVVLGSDRGGVRQGPRRHRPALSSGHARYGYFLSSEELSSTRMVAAAQQAESAGFDSILVSDHFHPWLDAQGESPFVWGVIGAIAATTHHRITTGVTCPTVRIHPAILAQAAATTQQLTEGRFRFGSAAARTSTSTSSGTGGRPWPPAWRCWKRPSRSSDSCGRAAW